MFSPQKDMKELVLEILKSESTSISGVSRQLAARGVKLHRLELTGYLKALADMNVLKERDIKPAKVFSVSMSREKNIFEIIGESCVRYCRTDDASVTLAAYTLQRLFKRPVFEMEVRRCGIPGTVDGRKATADERAEAKTVLAMMGYKVPNSDVPIVVEKDLKELFLQVMIDVAIETFNARSYVKDTTQLKL